MGEGSGGKVRLWSSDYGRGCSIKINGQNELGYLFS